jgi:hypothetical protein
VDAWLQRQLLLLLLQQRTNGLGQACRQTGGQNDRQALAGRRWQAAGEGVHLGRLV